MYVNVLNMQATVLAKYICAETIKISTWNINGWTQNNHLPRRDILSKLNADIVCLTETKLRSTDTILIENYRPYLFNRENLKKNSNLWFRRRCDSY